MGTLHRIIRLNYTTLQEPVCKSGKYTRQTFLETKTRPISSLSCRGRRKTDQNGVSTPPFELSDVFLAELAANKLP